MPTQTENFQGKKVLVFGLGRSGLAAARALQALGARVTLTDKKPASELGEWAAKAQALGLPVVPGGHPLELLDGADLIVLSPGVPNRLPVLQAAEGKGVPRWSEIELAYRLSRNPWVAITGTNGKTTTTSLVAELFKKAGRPHLLGGNIGTALADQVASLPEESTIVAEISSFQLEDVETFRPRVSVVTNLTPDHLDRYADARSYYAAKARIFARQGEGDFTILNADDPILQSWGGRCRSQVLWFSRAREVVPGAFLRQGEIVLHLAGRLEEVVMPAAELGIRGPHNLENALAALLAGGASGLPVEAMGAALREFKGVEHRLEPCGDVRQVHFVNDSKGTNVDSVEKALQSFSKPIHLILGGRDKEGDFTALSDLILKNVAALYLIGEAAGKIDGQVGHLKPRKFVASLAEAVRAAYKAAKPGEFVLLSPGCASFDMFNNYEHRGRVFKGEVASLKQEVEA